MPKDRRDTLDLNSFDSALSLDLDAGAVKVDLVQVRFVDAYALTGLACLIASRAGGRGRPARAVRRQELALPDALR